ncbi:DUF4357 domain-containing protein [Enterococcus pseudoavium]|uniref:DUF4357 domain-containing protein n=1 Tax=Enterococcus pseudoavium TaxID=44007 RepID=A0ABU3FFT0_9ENTE|nr:DUF4357 domain-containing protein [Enterococcus pseudoavium]MDT2755177.1 DUF4357 domain-containing protein [Enterococcus pseudoavium]MDT2769898.1 DUF4357 domain-containing protein [Enterococcus pseudoavium]
MIKLAVEIEPAVTKIYFDEQGMMTIYRELKKIPALTSEMLILSFRGREPQTIDHGKSIDKKILENSDSLVMISVPWELEIKALAQQMLAAWQTAGLKVKGLSDSQKIEVNHFPTVAGYQQELFEILATFGYENKKIKKKPAKAQHRWNKQISEISFYIDYNGATGEVIWQKRNEMLLKAGAKLTKEIPLNKDGSIGFSARLAEKLRADHADQISNFVTTEDLVFKSVNEIGMFLYYAGTNGWLVLKDENGKTIDEYSVVN